MGFDRRFFEPLPMNDLRQRAFLMGVKQAESLGRDELLARMEARYDEAERRVAAHAEIHEFIREHLAKVRTLRAMHAAAVEG